MKILAIYDKPSCVDRYTVYFDVPWSKDNPRLRSALGMSEDPYSHVGVCQHGSGMLGRHNGKKINLRDLPIDCLVVLIRELQDE